MIQFSLFDAHNGDTKPAASQVRKTPEPLQRTLEPQATNKQTTPFARGDSVSFLGRDFTVRFAREDGAAVRLTLQTEESTVAGPFYVHRVVSRDGGWWEGPWEMRTKAEEPSVHGESRAERVRLAQRRLADIKGGEGYDNALGELLAAMKEAA